MSRAQRALSLDDRSYQIYALIDPRDNAVRYVGMSIDAYVRRYAHLNSGGSNWYFVQWVKELKQLGLTPTLKVLEIIDAGIDAYATARKRESYWMHEMIRQGNTLLNVQGLPRREVPVSTPPQDMIECGTSDLDTMNNSASSEEAMSEERPLDESEEVLTVKEIARQLRVSEKTVRNWIAAGDLAAFDLGHGYRIKQSDYDDFLRNRYRRPSS